MNRFLLCLIAAAFFSTGPYATAQLYSYKDTHIVGKQPLTTIYDPASGFHIICGGWDVYYDDVFDPEDGDVLPSWWNFRGIASTTGTTVNFPIGLSKFRDLDFGNMGFPFRPGVRPGVDEQDSSGVLYISQNGRVKSYALKDGGLIDDTVANINASAVYYADGELFLSVRDTAGGEKVLVYNIAEDRFTDTLTAGINVQQVVKFAFTEQQYLAVLNEGISGYTNSTVQIFEISDGNYLLDTTIALGNGGNHIAVNGAMMAVTVSGSKQVILIDIPGFTIDKVIPILSGGEYDGPRESAIDQYEIFTTSYEGKVFIINSHTGEIQGDLESDGKAEGLLISKVLFVANPFVTGGYAPDSTVTTWSTPTSVESENVIKELIIYPNPVSDLISLNVGFGESVGMGFQFQISDLSGRIIYERNFIPDGDEFQIEFDISNIGMTAGSYYAIVKNSRYLRAVRFVKIK